MVPSEHRKTGGKVPGNIEKQIGVKHRNTGGYSNHGNTIQIHIRHSILRYSNKDRITLKTNTSRLRSVVKKLLILMIKRLNQLGDSKNRHVGFTIT